MPVQKGGRACAQVNGNVPNLTLYAGDQFHFGMGWLLVMNAAHGAALGGVGVVDLGDGLVPPSSSQFLSTEQAGQKATAVTQTLPLYAFEASQG
jgi:hypothetical protein